MVKSENNFDEGNEKYKYNIESLKNLHHLLLIKV